MRKARATKDRKYVHSLPVVVYAGSRWKEDNAMERIDQEDYTINDRKQIEDGKAQLLCCNIGYVVCSRGIFEVFLVHK